MTERGRREAFSKGQKEITAKLNMLVTVDVFLCEIEHVVDLVDGDLLKLFLSSKLSINFTFSQLTMQLI